MISERIVLSEFEQLLGKVTNYELIKRLNNEANNEENIHQENGELVLYEGDTRISFRFNNNGVLSGINQVTLIDFEDGKPDTSRSTTVHDIDLKSDGCIVITKTAETYKDKVNLRKRKKDNLVYRTDIEIISGNIRSGKGLENNNDGFKYETYIMDMDNRLKAVNAFIKRDNSLNNGFFRKVELIKYEDVIEKGSYISLDENSIVVMIGKDKIELLDNKNELDNNYISDVVKNKLNIDCLELMNKLMKIYSLKDYIQNIIATNESNLIISDMLNEFLAECDKLDI